MNTTEHSSEEPELGWTSVQTAEPIAEQKRWFGGEEQTSCAGVLLLFGILAQHSAMPHDASCSGAYTVTASSACLCTVLCGLNLSPALSHQLSSI